MRVVFNEFDQENFEAFLEQISKLKDKEDLDIYIDSSGGNTVICKAIQLILEKENKIRNVTLYSMMLISAGFELFYRTKVNKVVLDGSYAGIHFMGWNINLGNNAIPRGDFEKFKYDNQKSQKLKYKFMTKEECEIYDKGEMVYVNQSRLKEIIGQ